MPDLDREALDAARKAYRDAGTYPKQIEAAVAAYIEKAGLVSRGRTSGMPIAFRCRWCGQLLRDPPGYSRTCPKAPEDHAKWQDQCGDGGWERVWVRVIGTAPTIEERAQEAAAHARGKEAFAPVPDPYADLAHCDAECAGLRLEASVHRTASRQREGQLAEARAEVKQLREALDFYGFDDATWDGGEHARRALSSGGGDEG